MNNSSECIIALVRSPPVRTQMNMSSGLVRHTQLPYRTLAPEVQAFALGHQLHINDLRQPAPSTTTTTIIMQQLRVVKRTT